MIWRGRPCEGTGSSLIARGAPLCAHPDHRGVLRRQGGCPGRRPPRFRIRRRRASVCSRRPAARARCRTARSRPHRRRPCRRRPPIRRRRRRPHSRAARPTAGAAAGHAADRAGRAPDPDAATAERRAVASERDPRRERAARSGRGRRRHRGDRNRAARQPQRRRLRRRAGAGPEDPRLPVPDAAADPLQLPVQRQQPDQGQRLCAESRVPARVRQAVQVAVGQAAGRLRRVRLLEPAAGAEAGVRRASPVQAPAVHRRPLQAHVRLARAVAHRRVGVRGHRSQRQPDQGHPVRRPRRRRDGAGRSAAQAALAAGLPGRVRRRRRRRGERGGNHAGPRTPAPICPRRRCCWRGGWNRGRSST